MTTVKKTTLAKKPAAKRKAPGTCVYTPVDLAF
jgi:hypothetical protein